MLVPRLSAENSNRLFTTLKVDPARERERETEREREG